MKGFCYMECIFFACTSQVKIGCLHTLHKNYSKKIYMLYLKKKKACFSLTHKPSTKIFY